MASLALSKHRGVGLWILLAGSLWQSLSAMPCEAQTARTEHTLRLEPGPDRPAASMSDAAWLAGRWAGEGLDATVEETWLPPVGGPMAGVFRPVRDRSVQFYELVTLLEEDGSLVLRLKHFEPDLVGWEEKAESVDFPLLLRTSEALWFAGLTIRRQGEDRMKIWAALGGEGEGIREAAFEYRRVVGHEE